MQKTPLLQPSTLRTGLALREPKKKIKQVFTIWPETEDDEHLHQALLLVGDPKAQCKEKLRQMDADLFCKADEVINYLWHIHQSIESSRLALDYGICADEHKNDLDQTENPLYVPYEFYALFYEFTDIDRNLHRTNVEFSHVPIEGPVVAKNKKPVIRWSP